MMTSIGELENHLRFIREAADYFSNNPAKSSYGELAPGSLLALRWGAGDDCLKVLKLDEYWEPMVVQRAIVKEGK